MKPDLKILSAVLLLTLGLMGMKSLQPETMPLVPMMQLLLEDVYTVNQGIYTEDFRMMEKGAKNIAEHPVMTEEDKRLVKTVLGEEMKQFVSFDMIRAPPCRFYGRGGTSTQHAGRTETLSYCSAGMCGLSHQLPHGN